MCYVILIFLIYKNIMPLPPYIFSLSSSLSLSVYMCAHMGAFGAHGGQRTTFCSVIQGSHSGCQPLWNTLKYTFARWVVSWNLWNRLKWALWKEVVWNMEKKNCSLWMGAQTAHMLSKSWCRSHRLPQRHLVKPPPWTVAQIPWLATQPWVACIYLFLFCPEEW